VRLRAGTRAGDVAPFLERALVASQDERSLERGSLRRVAGERVAVLDKTSRDVPGGDCSALATIRHDRERSPLAVQLFERATRALAHSDEVAVAAANDAISAAKLALSKDEALAAEPSILRKECAGSLVQFSDVRAAVSETTFADLAERAGGLRRDAALLS
jgi:hypothetical protein